MLLYTCIKVELKNVNLVRDFWNLYYSSESVSTYLVFFPDPTNCNKLAVNTQSGGTRRVLLLYTHTLPFCVSLLIRQQISTLSRPPQFRYTSYFAYNFFVCVCVTFRKCLSLPLSLSLSLNLLFVSPLQMHLGSLSSTN